MQVNDVSCSSLLNELSMSRETSGLERESGMVLTFPLSQTAKKKFETKTNVFHSRYLTFKARRVLLLSRIPTIVKIASTVISTGTG
jgi:hypothetical protein